MDTIDEPTKEPTEDFERIRARGEKLALIKEQLKELSSSGLIKPFHMPLEDLIMVQMAGDFDGFIESLPKEYQAQEYTEDYAHDEDKAKASAPVSNARAKKAKRKEAGTAGNGKSPYDKMFRIIKETKEQVPTQRLFSEILRKTIQAQFGEKHAMLRELAQNARDAYDVRGSNPIIFDTSMKDADGNGQDDYLVLKVRDYGCGMDLKTIVKDLLIPYNSGKEFDPNKIGEHGIGWWSVVDVADCVKVVSRKEDEKHAVNVLIYPNGQKWRALIQPFSNDGFSKEYDATQAGTEVTAFIKKDKTDDSEISKYLYQYLGYVDDKTEGRILFKGKVINTLRDAYPFKVSAGPVKIDGIGQDLTFGASKRAVKGDFSDQRFLHRDKNLDKIVFTQKGLFVKYDGCPFGPETQHYKLMMALQNLGMDFWVDLPLNVTLTKGRNSIIADHELPVLQASYNAFESIFLDSLLMDDELLYHPSNILLEGMARVLRESSPLAKQFREGDYSFKRKVMSFGAMIGSGIVDGVSIAGQYTWKAASFVAKAPFKATAYVIKHAPAAATKASNYMIKQFPKDMKKAALFVGDKIIHTPGYIVKGIKGAGEWAKNSVVKLYDNRVEVAKKIGLGMGITAGVAGAVYGGYSLVKWYIEKDFGLKPILYGAAGLAGAAAVVGLGYGVKKLHANWPSVQKGISGIKDSLEDLVDRILHRSQSTVSQSDDAITAPSQYDNINLKQRKGFFDSIGDLVMKLFNTAGLYVNTEEKRENKRKKMREKLAKKYLTEFKGNSFINKIMNKKIITAEYYFNPESSEKTSSPVAQKKSRKFREILSDWFDPDYDSTQSKWGGSGVTNYFGGGISSTNAKYFGGGSSGFLEKRIEKISIMDMINLYLTKKIKYKMADTFWNKDPEIKAGDYFVDYKNPVVQTVISKLQESNLKVDAKYDVKILEDRIDKIWNAAKNVGAGLYIISPVGIAHLIISELTPGKFHKPAEGTDTYRRLSQACGWIKDGLVKSYNWIRDGYDSIDKKKLARGAYKVGKFLVTAPFLGVYYIGLGSYKGLRALGRWSANDVIVPFFSAINPKNYPDYIESIKQSSQRHKKERAERKEERAWKAERTRKRRQEEKESMRKMRELDRAAELERRKARKEMHPGLVSKLARSVRDWHQESALKRYFGYGMLTSDHYDNVGMHEVLKVEKSLKIGYSYANLMRTVTALDELVSRATHTSTAKVVFSERATGDNPKGDYGDKLYIEKKGKDLKLHIDFDYLHVERWVKNIASAMNPETNEFTRAAFNLSLLDAILHAKTHQALKKFKHQDLRYQPGCYHSEGTRYHDDEFLAKLSEMREKALDYLAKTGINISTYLDKAYVKPEQEGFDSVKPNYFNLLLRMTNKRLLDEKRYLDYARQKREEQVKKNADPANVKKHDIVSDESIIKTRYEILVPPPPPTKSEQANNWLTK